MFTLAISCSSISNLPWFMDLTFQVPMQYCSLQHWTLLPSAVTSKTGCSFCFGSISSFFLELFLHWPPLAFRARTDLGSSSFSVLSFSLFILFMGFSRQEYWSGLPFPFPVDYVLSELSTTTCPSWVALHSMTHSFIELDNTVVHVISLVSFLWLWILFLCSLIEKDKRVWQPPDERDWVRGKLGLVLMGGAMLSKSLIFCWWAGLCSLSAYTYTIVFKTQINFLYLLGLLFSLRDDQSVLIMCITVIFS